MGSPRRIMIVDNYAECRQLILNTDNFGVIEGCRVITSDFSGDLGLPSEREPD